MSTPDFIAIISGVAGIITAIGVLIVDIMQNRKTGYLLEYRMKNVEEKLNRHNKYAEKFEEIEIAITAIQKDISFLREENKK